MLRTLLLELAKSPRLRCWVTSNRATRRLAQRFVAGEDLALAIHAIRRCNQSGMTASLDHLGENVLDRTEAERARIAYTDALEAIAQYRLSANVSLKLTSLDLDLSEDFCIAQLRIVARRAAELQNFVRVDMEGSAYTERTLAIVKRVRAETDAVGTVIQAYLYRSEQDIRDLLSIGCRIRLVKGAYDEPPRIAFPRKRDVDANYVKLMRLLLPSGIYHAIATHDPKIIDATIQFASEEAIGKDKFEFQMLYGIRPDLQRRLAREGYNVRVYIPYGPDWFPYLMRRLAERPANLFFFTTNFARNLIRRTTEQP